MSSELSQGIVIGTGGLVVVFLGLVLIEIVIYFFNRYFEKKGRQTKAVTPSSHVIAKDQSGKSKPVAVPEEDLIAIATAIEFYRKVHFDQLQSQITFYRGNQQNNWKIGAAANQVLRK